MMKAIRQQNIRLLILNKHRVTVKELASQFNVSSRTIRSDLKTLADAGKCVLFHGGAKLAKSPEKTLFGKELFSHLATTVELPHTSTAELIPNHGSVYVLGSFNIDIVLDIDLFPQIGQTVHSSHTFFCPGGKGANQAAAAAKICPEVHFCTKVGQDEFGQRAKQYLHSTDIASLTVWEDPQHQTGHAVVLSNPNGDSMICCNPGANSHINQTEILQELHHIQDADIFLTQLENNFDITRFAVQKAHQFGKTVMLHPSPYTPQVRDILSFIDILTPGVLEAEALADMPITDLDSAKQAAAIITSKGVKHVIIPMMDKTYLWFDGGEYQVFPSYRSAVIDTTGIGDAFTGALAACLANRQNMTQAIRFACDFALLKIERKGASSMPTKDLVELFNQFKRSD
ncbi:ribokinase [Shewanella sp. NFH-SH190041]|uniref:PfkB family carbohydrate kinase n=1 Tax=Shewanella sp. NFH-SH190041 TaxID=2950245 RepID=UPI0021C2CF7B|nr:PfkB family carbohydrate kinase [Shewanella sp. NFH-SH190041]BDM63591.1 ribokinase [Shewanella sp. NFH-SH190041]